MRRSALVPIVGLALVFAAVSGCGDSGDGKPAVAFEGTIVFKMPYKGQHADIYLLDAKGTRQLAANGQLQNASPAWSPDGTQIAYITDTWQLAVVRRDGSGGATLTPTSSDQSMWPHNPAWLPDGNISIAVAGGLAVLRPDGSGVRVLTPSDPEPGGQFDVWSPYAWSPDGTQLVFACFPNVCLFDPESGASRTLLAPPQPLSAFAWSPGGTNIVAGDSQYTDSEGSEQRDLYVFDADGQALRALPQPGGERNPAWSPDGTRIVYESTAGSDYTLWVMNADGSGAQELLVPGERMPTEADWSAR